MSYSNMIQYPDFGDKGYIQTIHLDYAYFWQVKLGLIKTSRGKKGGWGGLGGRGGCGLVGVDEVSGWSGWMG